MPDSETGLAKRLRHVLQAYNEGDPGPLIATFSPDVEYHIVQLGQSFSGRAQVTDLARSGTGNTAFDVRQVITLGPLLAYSYHHTTTRNGTEYHGPGLAVELHDSRGRLRQHWAFRA